MDVQPAPRLDREAVGTGPFRLVSYEPSRLCVVERNPAYYDPARPLLDRVELVLFPDANARTAAQLAGNTDLLLFGQPTEYERLNGAAGQVALRTPSVQFLDIILGSKDKPFDDVRVREALALTLDRDALVELVAEGLGSPGADTPSNAAYLFDAGLPPRKPDIARARALLAEAGYPRGVTATLVASDRPNTRAQLAVAIRAMAKPARCCRRMRRQCCWARTRPPSSFLPCACGSASTGRPRRNTPAGPAACSGVTLARPGTTGSRSRR